MNTKSNFDALIILNHSDQVTLFLMKHVGALIIYHRCYWIMLGKLMSKWKVAIRDILMKPYLQLKARRLLRSQSCCNAPFLMFCRNVPTRVCLPLLCLFLTRNQNCLSRFFFLDNNMIYHLYTIYPHPLFLLCCNYGCNIYHLYVFCFSHNGEW